MRFRFAATVFSVLLLLCCGGRFTALAQGHHQSNLLDSLKTPTEIESFLCAQNPQFKTFKVGLDTSFYYTADSFKCRRFIDSVGVKSIVKVDFDANGLTDILLIGKFGNLKDVFAEADALCILSKGDKKYQIISLANGFTDNTFPVVKEDSDKVIVLNYQQSFLGLYTTLKVDTLTYLIDDFVELNTPNNNLRIEKIEYSTSSCYSGECPVFSLVIDSNRCAYYSVGNYKTAKNYKKGKFKATIDSTVYDKMVSVLKYIDFPQLNTDYKIAWTDQQACNLVVTFNGGQVKAIRDYGMVGTYGLKLLYKYLRGPSLQSAMGAAVTYWQLTCSASSIPNNTIF